MKKKRNACAFDKMQLTTKNYLNQMKMKGVMARYGKYSKSVWQYDQK